MTRVLVRHEDGGPSWTKLADEAEKAGGTIDPESRVDAPTEGMFVFRKRSQARTFIRTVRGNRWKAIVQIAS